MHFLMQLQTTDSLVFLSPCGYISHSSVMASHAMPFEGSKVMHINIFLPCPMCAEISLDFLNLFTKLCMVAGERPKFFAILH